LEKVSMDDRPCVGERVNSRAWSDIIAEAARIESRHFNHFTSRQGSGILFGADPLNGQIWERLSSLHRENDGIAAARAAFSSSWARVRILNKVVLPTCGSPMIPVCIESES
jgi:hypothetical protein